MAGMRALCAARARCMPLRAPLHVLTGHDPRCERWVWAGGKPGHPARPAVADADLGAGGDDPSDGVAVEDVVYCGYVALLLGCCMRQPGGAPATAVRPFLPLGSFAPLGVTLTTFVTLQVRRRVCVKGGGGGAALSRSVQALAALCASTPQRSCAGRPRGATFAAGRQPLALGAWECERAFLRSRVRCVRARAFRLFCRATRECSPRMRQPALRGCWRSCTRWSTTSLRRRCPKVWRRLWPGAGAKGGMEYKGFVAHRRARRGPLPLLRAPLFSHLSRAPPTPRRNAKPQTPPTSCAAGHGLLVQGH